MAHKKKHGAPVPPANRAKMGGANSADDAAAQSPAEVASAQEQGPKRRLGDYTGTGEHPRQQPSQLNDGNQHSR